VIVGRTRERSELEAVLEAARHGRSTALVVHGEAGIGKTTLLDEAVAAAPDFRVLRARGYESESDIPFAGLLDLLTPLLELLDRIPPAQAAALRGTANRVASILSPLAMGAIAEAVGLEYSFYVVGALVSIVMLGIAVYLWRNPHVSKAGED
jgi:predicted ATPase